ncbi:Rieske 2Fe-2S domain-containing protein [Streptomyces sp. NPDC057499]|uniref:Rieske (2Fe-2S) protein n=1 Tax=Streptomyces sp. NPDC057499 TaxID=3346150 RepID=UPI0036AAE2D2
MNTSRSHGVGPGRRTVVVAAGTASVAAVLAACGNSKESSGSSTAEPSAHTTAATPTATTGGGTVLADTAEIPEGGGKIFADRHVVVTQPKAGEFKAFSSTCTHQGCTVSRVADGTIDCPCHGSKFNAATGAVVHGPATRPLPAKRITVAGGSIALTP